MREIYAVRDANNHVKSGAHARQTSSVTWRKPVTPKCTPIWGSCKEKVTRESRAKSAVVTTGSNRTATRLGNAGQHSSRDTRIKSAKQTEATRISSGWGYREKTKKESRVKSVATSKSSRHCQACVSKRLCICKKKFFTVL